MTRQIRVLVVDDHAIVREGLQRVLELADDLTVVGLAGDGTEGVRLAQEMQPDVVLMDVNMPALNGIEAARRIRTSCPDTRVLILTIHDDPEYLGLAARAEVSGYILKDVDPAELVRAVRQAAAGQSYLHPDMGGRLLRQMARQEGAQPAVAAAGGGSGPGTGADDLYASLTPREREVLRYLARGTNNREIADALFISEKTVKNHISHILQKTGAQDRLQAVLLALRRGWVEPGDA